MGRATPLGALARGLLAGVAGTAAMTAAQQVARKFQSAADAESGGWESAPAPAQVGKRILEGVFGRTVPASKIDLLTQVMHWTYGVAWGAAYGLIQETVVAWPARCGLLFGAGVWGASYLELVPMGIYEPPWRYPFRTVALDATYHVVYGEAVAAAYAAIDPR